MVSNVVEISDELLQVQNEVVLSMDGLEVNSFKNSDKDYTQHHVLDGPLFNKVSGRSI